MRRVPSGFALVIALGLMSFILLLLLSLTTFVRVESQRASWSQAELQARTNAKLGLMVAIGELQKSAGPDQRTTATADLAARNLFGDRLESGGSPANNDPLGQGGRGLTAVREGTRYWTGKFKGHPHFNDGRIYRKEFIEHPHFNDNRCLLPTSGA